MLDIRLVACFNNVFYESTVMPLSKGLFQDTYDSYNLFYNFLQKWRSLTEGAIYSKNRPPD